MAWDEDDYDGMERCAFCGKRFPDDESHLCEGMRRDAEEKAKAWEKQYVGRGLVKGQLVIDYVCFDSKDSFNHVLNLVALGGGHEEGRHNGSDKHDGRETIFWKTEHIRKLV